MSLVEELRQGQEISSSKIVGMLPLFVVVGTADGDGMGRSLLALVLPDRHLDFGPSWASSGRSRTSIRPTLLTATPTRDEMPG